MDRNHCEYGHYEEDNPIWPRCVDEHADEIERMEREDEQAMEEAAAGLEFGGSG